jgi:hypothetical protein
VTAFITPEELKAYPLPVTDKQWDKVTDEHLSSVTAYATTHIEDYLDRTIMDTLHTQRLVGNDRYTLLLEHYPVISLESVSAYDLYENQVGYDVSDFIVHAGSGIIEWVNKSRNIFSKYRVWEVRYSAGYTTVPGPIKHATALQCVEMLQPLFRGGSNFVEVELINDLNEQIVDMLEKYKRKRMG